MILIELLPKRIYLLIFYYSNLFLISHKHIKIYQKRVRAHACFILRRLYFQALYKKFIRNYLNKLVKGKKNNEIRNIIHFQFVSFIYLPL